MFEFQTIDFATFAIPNVFRPLQFIIDALDAFRIEVLDVESISLLILSKFHMNKHTQLKSSIRHEHFEFLTQNASCRKNL